MNSGQRSRIGFIGSIVTHIFILLFVSFVGLFNLSHPPANDIVEVSLFGGGGGGGGNDSDIEDSNANDEENSTEEDVQEEPTPDPEAIWKNDENKPQPVHKKSAVKKVARKGSGTGQGSGHGSGVGPGTGSGSGGGNGSIDDASQNVTSPTAATLLLQLCRVLSARLILYTLLQNAMQASPVQALYAFWSIPTVLLMRLPS